MWQGHISHNESRCTSHAPRSKLVDAGKSVLELCESGLNRNFGSANNRRAAANLPFAVRYSAGWFRYIAFGPLNVPCWFQSSPGVPHECNYLSRVISHRADIFNRAVSLKWRRSVLWGRLEYHAEDFAILRIIFMRAGWGRKKPR